MEYARQRIVSALVVAATFVASAAVYPSLPAEMATHWNAAGEVDDTMGTLWGAFLVPAVMVGVWALLLVSPRIDPRKSNVMAFRGAYEWFVAGFLAFLGYVHGLVLAWNLGYQIPMNQALAVPLAGLFVGIGMLIERAEPNWIVGIRTPWTLSDDEVWAETHERGATAFKLAGVATLGALVFPDSFLVFVLGPVLLASAYTVGYSLLAYHRKDGTS